MSEILKSEVCSCDSPVEPSCSLPTPTELMTSESFCLDLARDCDSDGIPDVYHDAISEDTCSPAVFAVDEDESGLSDYLELSSGYQQISAIFTCDINNNGILDIQENTPNALLLDVNSNGIAEFWEVDANRNMIPDAGEADTNSDGFPDILAADEDGNGIPDALQTSANCNDLPDIHEIMGPDSLLPSMYLVDLNEDGLIDICQTDMNDNGKADCFEVVAENGIPYVLQTDLLDNGLPDIYEVKDQTDNIAILSHDSNGDNKPDVFEQCEWLEHLLSRVGPLATNSRLSTQLTDRA